MNPFPRQSRTRTAIAACAALFLAAALALPAAAQKAKPAPKPHPAPHTVYRLDYVIRQLRGGKVINQRRYDLLLEEGQSGGIRVDNRVPFPAGDSYGYAQAVMNLDAKILPQGETVRLQTHVRIQSPGAMVTVPDPHSPTKADEKQPIMVNISTTVNSVLQPDVPTTLARLDDVSSNDTYRITVTAVPQRP